MILFDILFLGTLAVPSEISLSEISWESTCIPRNTTVYLCQNCPSPNNHHQNLPNYPEAVAKQKGALFWIEY